METSTDRAHLQVGQQVTAITSVQAAFVLIHRAKRRSPQTRKQCLFSISVGTVVQVVSGALLAPIAKRRRLYRGVLRNIENDDRRQARLKRSERPARTFFLILAFDEYARTLRAVFKDSAGVPQNLPPLMDLGMIANTLLLMTLLTKSALSQLRRDEDDHLDRALVRARLQDYAGAYQLVDGFPPTKQKYLLESISLLGLGKFERSFEVMKKYCGMVDEELDEVAIETLFYSASTLKKGEDTQYNLIRYFLDHRPCDAVISSRLFFLGMLDGSANEYLRLVNQSNPSGCACPPQF